MNMFSIKGCYRQIIFVGSSSLIKVAEKLVLTEKGASVFHNVKPCYFDTRIFFWQTLLHKILIGELSFLSKDLI